MLDIKFIKNNTENIKELIAFGRGNPDKVNIDKLLELDDKRVELIQDIEELNKQRNEIAKLGKQGKIEEAREKGRQIREELKMKEEEFKDVLQKWEEIMMWIPNMPQNPQDMPKGNDETDNIILKAWTPDTGYIKDLEGKKARGFSEEHMPEYPIHAKEKDFKPLHHLDIGMKLGIIDNEQSALTSGSRFTYILGKGALLQYAIQQLLFEELINRGFNYIIPPLLVRERVLFGTSHFPEGYDQVYKIENFNVEEENDLYLVGSTEPANFAYFMDKTLDEEQLPIKLFAYAPAFRSEAGSWGKDTKGIKRVHQFDKIEMNVVCTPDQSSSVFNELLDINEWLLQKLKLPYQLALKCTGDAGYLASAKQVDPEVWIPAQKEFMEVMTDTNTTDFQARRFNIKYSTKDGGKNYVHTVNDTGGAMGRLIISIISHYQQKDGSVLVPEALQPYLNFEKII